MIFINEFLLILFSLNPHLNTLVESIRCNNLTNTNLLWQQYTNSLLNKKLFSENTYQLGGLSNIKSHEIKFIDRKFTEAEFAYQIGIDFFGEAMSEESEWFLNKAESLGYVNERTYYAHAHNNAEMWNDILHYNDDPNDPALFAYEEKWRINLIQFIQHSNDSIEIYQGRLELTAIYWPFRTPGYVDTFAPAVIAKLQDFINKYPHNPLIEQAYEKLVWWLYETKRYDLLRETCLCFLKKHQNAKIIEYIKYQLGNAYYFSSNFDESINIYSSIDQNSFPDRVYPGWGGSYILADLNRKIEVLKGSK